MADTPNSTPGATPPSKTPDQLQADAKAGSAGATGTTGRPITTQAPLATPGRPPQGDIVAGNEKSPEAQQGFAATEREQQSQTSPLGDAQLSPGGPNDPLRSTSGYKEKQRKGPKGEATQRHVVKDPKFTFGGDRFTTGDEIYLTDEEAQRIKGHLQEDDATKNRRQEDERKRQEEAAKKPQQ